MRNAQNGWKSTTAVLGGALAAGLMSAAGLLGAPAAGLIGAGVMMGAAPEPNPVPRRWEIELEVGPLRMATVSTAEGPRRFYYLTYKAINNSGQDLLFAPMWELSTGTGEVLRSGRDVPLAATKELLDSTQNPFIEDQISIIGTMLQGRENAKEGIVIWPAKEAEIDQLSIYAAGFSGETATVTVPDSDEQVVLRKTLKLDYEIPGLMAGLAPDPLPVKAKQWIMR